MITGVTYTAASTIGPARRDQDQAKVTSPVNWVVACWAGLLLCVIIPGYVLIKMSEDHAIRVELGDAAAVQLLITAWAGARLAAMIAAARLRPVAFFFWCYVYVWLGVAGAAQIATGMTPVPAPLTPQTIQDTQVLILVGLIAWEVGALYARTVTGRPTEPRTVTVTRLRVPLALGLLAISPLVVINMGGVKALFTSRQAPSDALQAAGWLTTGDHLSGALLVRGATVTAFVLLYLSVWRLITLQRRSVGSWFLVLLLAGLNVVVNNPISLPRFWFATTAVSLVLLYRRFAVGRLFMVVIVLCLIVVFPYADKFRYSGSSSAGLGVHGSIPLTEQFVSNGGYDSFPQVVSTTAYVADNGPTYGRQLEGVLLFWLPRKLWPDKPLDTGIVLARYKGNGGNENLSAPLWAELDINFGLIGVGLGFAALGLVSRRLDLAYLRDILGRRHTMATLLVPVMAAYQIILLRGSLLQSMSRLAVLVVLGLLLLRRRERLVDGDADVGEGSGGRAVAAGSGTPEQDQGPRGVRDRLPRSVDARSRRQVGASELP